MKRAALATALMLSFVLQSRAATATSITSFGITFEFDAAVTNGQFASGDYWVLAPVTITNMTPAPNGSTNGWMVNPSVISGQSFTTRDAKGLETYDGGLLPSLPWTGTTNCTVVKIIDSTVSRPLIQTAVALTVLESVPENDGATVFRPPFIGTEKPLYTFSDMLTNKLPSLTFSGTPPSLATLATNFNKCLRMDYHPTHPRYFRPVDAYIDDYQPAHSGPIYEAMMRLMLDDAPADKHALLVLFAQNCLDRAYIVMDGYRQGGDGHNNSHRIQAAFAAMLFDIQDVWDYLNANNGFHEEQYVKWSATASAALWGETDTELNYWNYIMGLGGGRSTEDPYGYIDGGNLTTGGAEYQLITAQQMKGQVLAATLISELKGAYYTNYWPSISNYAARWVSHGVLTSPDPAAPYDGTNSNYGVTFGPDGGGGYIAGSGRFPASDGADTDGGQYKSTFVADMWTQFFDSTDTNAPAFSSASIATDGTTLTVVFGEATVVGSGGSGGMTISVDGGGAQAATYSSGSGTTSLVYTVPTVYSGETVTVSYTNPGDGLEDAAGNDVATISAESVTNSSTQTEAPAASGAGTIRAETVTIGAY